MLALLDSHHPNTSLRGTAPVPMQHGTHSDRIALARLSAERRWLVRHRDKARLAPDHPPYPGADDARARRRLDRSNRGAT
jgi:hypothetical protein